MVLKKNDHVYKFVDFYAYFIFQTTSVTTEEILNLSGGGDWHTAYICVYEAKKLPIFTPDLDDQMDTQQAWV